MHQLLMQLSVMFSVLSKAWALRRILQGWKDVQSCSKSNPCFQTHIGQQSFPPADLQAEHSAEHVLAVNVEGSTHPMT